ncbi:hypothetical protein DV735_g2361, partial [Chaetothyriales sp. CBS 134920]
MTKIRAFVDEQRMLIMGTCLNLRLKHESNQMFFLTATPFEVRLMERRSSFYLFPVVDFGNVVPDFLLQHPLTPAKHAMITHIGTKYLREIRCNLELLTNSILHCINSGQLAAFRELLSLAATTEVVLDLFHIQRMPYSTLKEQKAFEKGLLEKTAKQTSDVILYDNKVVVFKAESDVMLYVVGSADENEILLYNVILALRDTLSILLKNSTDKRTIIENYDLVTLAIDEIVDDGIVLETDPVMVATRVSKAPAQDAPNMKNIDLSEQGIQNLWEFGKKQGIEFVRRNL